MNDFEKWKENYIKLVELRQQIMVKTKKYLYINFDQNKRAKGVYYLKKFINIK